MLELRVHPKDIGQVIGYHGPIVEALRTILGAAGMKLHKRVRVEILDKCWSTALPVGLYLMHLDFVAEVRGGDQLWVRLVGVQSLPIKSRYLSVGAY